MKDMIKSLSLCAVGSVLIGSAVGQTGGSNREEGGVHTHNGNQVFWSAHAHDCPEDCGIDTFMQTRSVTCLDHPTNNLINDDDCDPALRLADSRECPATDPCPVQPVSIFTNRDDADGGIWPVVSNATCNPSDGTFTQTWTPTYPFNLAFHAKVSSNGAVDCSFSAGDESSCTDTAGCSYTAPVAAVAEVADTCTAPACTFESGDAGTCGAGCTYTAPVTEVAEACTCVDTNNCVEECTGFTTGDSASCAAASCEYIAPVTGVTEACAASVDCTFTAGDSSTCDTSGGCAYTEPVEPVAQVAEACAAPEGPWDVATVTSEVTDVTLTGPLVYDTELYVDPDTGATAYMAHWDYEYHHTIPGRSTSVVTGHDHQGTGTCYIPNSIVVAPFSHDGPDTIEEGVTETWGEYTITPLVEWLDLSAEAMAENPQGVWREVQSGGQVGQGHLIRLRFWVEDPTGTMGVFITDMDLVAGSESLALVREGQGNCEEWGCFTQAVRNGLEPEMDSSVVELLVAHDLEGGQAEITTRMTVTHDKVAHDHWLNPLGLNLGGGRRLQNSDGDTVQSTVHINIGGSTTGGGSSGTTSDTVEQPPSGGCLAGADGCATTHEEDVATEVATVFGEVRIAATMAEVDEDRPAFEANFKTTIVEQFATNGVTITSADITVTQIAGGRRRMQEGSSGVVVSYVVEVPCGGDCAATTTEAEAANTQTLEAAEAGSLTVGTFDTVAPPPPPAPPVPAPAPAPASTPTPTPTPVPAPSSDEDASAAEAAQTQAIADNVAAIQTNADAIQSLGQDIADGSLTGRANTAAAEANAAGIQTNADAARANSQTGTSNTGAIASLEASLATALTRIAELEAADTTHTTTLQQLGATDSTTAGRLDALETTEGNDSTTISPGVADDSTSLVNGAISGAIAAVAVGVLLFATKSCCSKTNDGQRPRKYAEKGGTPMIPADDYGTSRYDLEAASPSPECRAGTPDRQDERRQVMATTPPRGGGRTIDS